MSTHYHLALETPKGNLVDGMGLHVTCTNSPGTPVTLPAAPWRFPLVDISACFPIRGFTTGPATRTTSWHISTRGISIPASQSSNIFRYREG
jgi:hypothetical protein